MKIWEIIKGFAEGSFIEGDVFCNELGQELHYDGESIKGLNDLDPAATWEYIPYKPRWESA